jgi:hypothetical protein
MVLWTDAFCIDCSVLLTPHLVCQLLEGPARCYNHSARGNDCLGTSTNQT